MDEAILTILAQHPNYVLFEAHGVCFSLWSTLGLWSLFHEGSLIEIWQGHDREPIDLPSFIATHGLEPILLEHCL